MAENPKKEWPRSLAPRRAARFSRQKEEKKKYESLVASKDKRRFQGQWNLLQQTDK